MMHKQDLRERMRRARRALSPEEQSAAAQGVFERLRDFAPYKDATCVMAYVACRGEVSLDMVMADMLSSGKMLVLPRCEAPGVMTARRIGDLSQLAPGSYGIMEPRAACEIVPPEKIDLVFVPGTAFDKEGGRLGQGGGYYDRFLPGTNAFRAGVCHKEALLERVPRDAHDAKMDAVITPDTIIRLCDHRRNGHE